MKKIIKKTFLDKCVCYHLKKIIFSHFFSIYFFFLSETKLLHKTKKKCFKDTNDQCKCFLEKSLFLLFHNHCLGSTLLVFILLFLYFLSSKFVFPFKKKLN